MRYTIFIVEFTSPAPLSRHCPKLQCRFLFFAPRHQIRALRHDTIGVQVWQTLCLRRCRKDPMVNDPPAPAPRETRQSTSGAVFVVLEPISNPTDLALMANLLEQRADTLTVAAGADRLRRVAARLRARSAQAL